MTQHTHATSSECLVSLPVLLLQNDDKNLKFLHLGTEFSVAASDVLDIQPCSIPIPNPQNVGVPQLLVLKELASINRSETVLARDLMSEVPFVMARPTLTSSIVRPFDLDEQRREKEWLVSQGIKPADEITMTTYTRTDSSQSTETRSNGVVDDQNSDSMPNDDATPSD